MLVQGKEYNKNGILKKCKSILEKTDIYGFVNDEDFSFLMDVFSCHPYWDMKTCGKKIVAIQKRPSGNYNSHCFWLVRDDDTITDISYRKVFEKNEVMANILAAMRHAIRPDIEAFRETFEPFNYNGRWISDIHEVDVDHYDMKFRELAAIWIEYQGGVDNLAAYINDITDGSSITCFTDDALVLNFRKFHIEHTNLRFIPKEENQRLG